MQMSKRKKRTKPAKTTEQQAAEEGWILVFLSKTIRGWNSIWVEEARGVGRRTREKLCVRVSQPPLSVSFGGRANDAATAG